MFDTTLLNADQLCAAISVVRRSPYPLLVAHGLLSERLRLDLNRDFPAFRQTGFVPYEESECGASINQLIRDLTAREFVDAIGARLGLTNLHAHPALVEIRRRRDDRHVAIQVGSASKVATALLHLNDGCPSSDDECLHFLSDANDVPANVASRARAEYGEFVAFARTEKSYHGLLPYRGERRVIQVSWLTDDAAFRRKTRHRAASTAYGVGVLSARSAVTTRVRA